MADNIVEVQFGAKTKDFVAGVEEVKTESRSLNQALNEAFSHTSESIRLPLDALAEMKSSLRETAEVAGAAFGVEKLKEFAESMAEAGEHTLNTAHMFGTSVNALADLQAHFILAGGSADDAERTFLRLGRTFQSALVDKTGASATALHNLHFSQAEIVAGSKDLTEGLELVIQKFNDLEPAYRNVGLLTETTGRGAESLAGILRKGAEGWEEDAAAAQKYADVIKIAAPAEAETAEKGNQLTLALKQLGHDGFLLLKPDIDFVEDALKAFVTAADWVIEKVQSMGHYFAWLGNIARSMFGDLIPTLGLGDLAFGLDVTAPAPKPGTTPAGTAKPGPGPKAKGQASEIELWQEELNRQLTAEGEFFKDSTAEELAFWQSKLALTKNGSKEQYEVEQKIFQLRKELARQTEQEAEHAIDAQKRVSDAQYQRQIAAVESQVKLGTLTPQQGLEQEIALLNAKWAADQAYYSKKEAAAQGDLRTQQEIANQEMVAQQGYLTQLQKLTTDAALQVQQQWKQTWQQVGDQVGSALADMLDRTATWGDAMRKLLDGLLKDLFKSMFSNLLFGGGGPSGGLGGALFGSGGLSGALGLGNQGILGTLAQSLGIAGSAGSAISGISSLASGGGLLGGLLGSVGSISGVGTADVTGTAASGALGFLGSLFSSGGGFLSFLGLSRGGIVPSAAGGWTVPSFANGGIASILHPREMVLPAPISEGLQQMIAGGGGQGGHTFNIHTHSLDAASAGPKLVAILNSAMRNGSMLRVPS